MMVDKTTLSLSEDVVRVTVAEDVTTISIAPTITKIEAKGIAISSAAGASGTTVQPYGTIMFDSKLGRSKRLPTNNTAVIIFESTSFCSWLS